MGRFPIVLFFYCLAVPGCLNAETADNYVDRGEASFKIGDCDMAIADFNQALAAANPKDPKNRDAIFRAYYYRGCALDEKGEHDKAIADYSEALAIDPKNDRPYSSRGIAWARSSEYDKAIADYNQALAINPNCAAVYSFRGRAWEYKGDYGKAIADYRNAAAIDPDYVSSYEKLAWIYATCPDAKYRDGKKAVENASKAKESRVGKDWGILDTLAAAYAESGDFAKAREFEDKAIDLAPEKLKPDLRSRLELYKQEKSFREELKKK